jgi:hypothetical protein
LVLRTLTLWLTIEEYGYWRRAVSDRRSTLPEFVRKAVGSLVEGRQPARAELSFSSPRRGRPTRGETRPRCDHLVKVRLPSKEYAAWSKFSASRGITLSALVRGATEAAIKRGRAIETRPRVASLDKAAIARLLHKQTEAPTPPSPLTGEFLAAVSAGKIADEMKEADFKARGLPWPPRRPKGYVGKVAAEIWKNLGPLKLERSGFQDLESKRKPDGLLSNRGWPSDRKSSASDRLYYELVGQAAEDPKILPDPEHRAFARAISDGGSIRSIKRKLRCGQARFKSVERAIKAAISGA